MSFLTIRLPDGRAIPAEDWHQTPTSVRSGTGETRHHTLASASDTTRSCPRLSGHARAPGDHCTGPEVGLGMFGHGAPPLLTLV